VAWFSTSSIYEALFRLACAGIVIGVAGYELVQAIDLVSDLDGNAVIIDSYLKMTYAPPGDQWRSIHLPAGTKLIVAAAAAVHLLTTGILTVGLCRLLLSVREASAFDWIALGFLLAVAYYVLFGVFVAGWLRLSSTAALGLCTAYMVFAGFFMMVGRARS